MRRWIRYQTADKNKNRFPFSCYDFYFYSDDFIQAQQPIARWASEDVVSVVLEPDSTQSISIKTPHQTAPSVSLATAAQSVITTAINDSSLQIQQLQHYQDAADTITSTATMSDSPMGKHNNSIFFNNSNPIFFVILFVTEKLKLIFVLLFLFHHQFIGSVVPIQVMTGNGINVGHR